MPFAFCIAVLSVAGLWWRHGRRTIMTQERVGRNGELFVIHKLRTMAHDRYLTRLGGVVAVLGADETPQLLYTIWSGKMALIGPRPLILQDFSKMMAVLSPEEYSEWYTAYTSCRPGWMGAFSRQSRLYVAQSREYLRARYHWDTYYLKNACFTLDIIILAKSLTMWCTPPRRLWNALKKLVASKKRW